MNEPRRFLHVVIVAAVVLSAPDASAFAQPPAREGQRPPTGSAAISGTVLSDERDPRPLRRARVTVNNAERTVGRTAITDDTGRFEFDGLPAGRYSLTAGKDGWVSVTFGQRRPGRPGTAIVVTEGQRIADITLRVPRGSVLTGTVVDENGQPFVGASVTVSRSTIQNGVRTFFPAGTAQQTDDRGTYRIYGLQPGEYIVAAVAALGQGPSAPEVRMVTDADVRRAMSDLRSSSSSRPGMVPTGANPAAVAAPSENPTIAYAPVYYPGVTFPSQATRLTIGAGEERGGIDFQLHLVRTAKIEGTLVAPPDVSPQLAVMMVAASETMPIAVSGHFRTTRADAQGRFVFNGVTPGQYSIVTRGGPVAAAPRPQQPGARPTQTPSMWAQADLTVEGRDLSDVILALQPGLTVPGVIRFEGSTLPPPPDLTRLRVSLFAVQVPGEVSLGVPPVQVEADGRFTVRGVIPGRYRVSSMVPGDQPDRGWVLKSAMLGGRDVLDTTLEVKAHQEPPDLVLTFTDRPTELSGAVQDASGAPAPDYFIIAFTTDRALWMPQARRIQAVRPSADGRYRIRNLPPGDYFLAAADDVETGEWYDPGFLQQLLGGAMKVTLGDGEQKTQDLRLATDRR
jgi:protocatechuate 3,4-dioxygenase beta subunit